jgi:hypothetical protein
MEAFEPPHRLMLPCMSLILRFHLNPSPRGLNYTNDGRPAGMNMHVLYRDLLLPLAAMAVERVEQHCQVRESLSAWFKCSCRK